MSISALMPPPAAPPAGGVPATTIPVTRRAPSGTSTRTPGAGTSTPSGTRYVSRSSAGTGTATETRRDIGTGIVGWEQDGHGRPSGRPSSDMSGQASRLPSSVGLLRENRLRPLEILPRVALAVGAA